MDGRRVVDRDRRWRQWSEQEARDALAQNPDQEQHVPAVLGDALGIGDAAQHEAAALDAVQHLQLQEELQQVLVAAQNRPSGN